LSSLLFPFLGFIILRLSHLSFLGYLTPSCERFLNYFKEGKKHLCECFLFAAGVGNLGEFFVFLPNALVIVLMGRLFLGAGEDGV
jgi:hypothetical protein